MGEEKFSLLEKGRMIKIPPLSAAVPDSGRCWRPTRTSSSLLRDVWVWIWVSARW